jgi:hypothetical protein
MRVARLLLSLLIVFSSSPRLNSQQSTTSVQRDPQALLVLQQCLSAAGSPTALSAIRDVTGLGNITYYWAGQQVQGTLTARGRGAGQFRLDSALSAGSRSWAVSNGDGSLKETDGTLHSIPYHNAINLGGVTFPFFAITAALQNSSTTVVDLGLVSAEGRQARQIRVQQNFPSAADPQGIFSKLTLRDFFLDVSTLRLIKIRDVTHPVQTFMEDYPHEFLFSDYRLVNGVLAPFAISETINGQQTWTIQLNQVTFDSGLTDSDFQM